MSSIRDEVRQLAVLLERRRKVLEELKAVDDQIEAISCGGMASNSHGTATNAAPTGPSQPSPTRPRKT